MAAWPRHDVKKPTFSLIKKVQMPDAREARERRRTRSTSQRAARAQRSRWAFFIRLLGFFEDMA